MERRCRVFQMTLSESERAGCDDTLDALQMSSITYRIATDAQAGRKVATLQTSPADNGLLEGDVAKVWAALPRF